MKKILLMFVFVLLLIAPAYAEVLTPADNEVLDTDFYVTVQAVNASAVQAKMVGYSWQSLEQISGDTYTKKFLISEFPNGDYILSVKYTTENGTAFFKPLNLKILKPGGTPASGSAGLGNMSLVGLAAGNYSNQTKMWVSVIDAGNSSPVTATISFLNPAPAAVWTTQNGLTKVDMSGLAPESYLVKVESAGYTTISFFVNITAPPIPKITVEGFREFIESGNVMSLRFSPESVDLSLMYWNGSLVQNVTRNTSDFRINTSELTEIDYKLRASRVGYENWTGTFTVVRPKATPTPTPIPTPIPTPATTVFVPEVGRYMSLEQRDAFYVGMNLKSSTPTPTPTSAPPPVITPSPEQKTDVVPYLLFGGVAVAGIAYEVKRRKDEKTIPVPAGVTIPTPTRATPVEPETFESQFVKTIHPPPEKAAQSYEALLICPHCTSYSEVVNLPPGFVVTEELRNAYLASHISKEHAKKE